MTARANSTTIRSVPTETTLAAVRTSTAPGGGFGTGISTISVRPLRIF